MGNTCCTVKKYRYNYIAVSATLYSTYNKSSILSLSCHICHQYIDSVLVECNECKAIAHAGCINDEKPCMLCMQ